MTVSELLNKPIEALSQAELEAIQQQQKESWHIEWKVKIDDATGKVARSAASFANAMSATWLELSVHT